MKEANILVEILYGRLPKTMTLFSELFSSIILKGNILNGKIIDLDKILFTENDNNFQITKIILNEQKKVLSIDELILDYENTDKLKNNIKLVRIDDNKL